MAGKSTKEAFLKRGLSTEQAEQLVKANILIKDIQAMTETELANLGLNLTKDQTESLLTGRPPIPDEIYDDLMYKSKRVCCICRDYKKGIIIHHIEEWAISRSHELENLVVLCLHHHGEAHTKRELSKNLTPEDIKSARKKWYEEVQNSDKSIIISRATADFATILYFNHTRMYDLISHAADVSKLSLFNKLLNEGIIESSGKMKKLDILVDKKSSSYMYQDGKGMYLSAYHTEMFLRIFNKLELRLITSLSDSEVRNIVKEGDFVFVEGPFFFKKENKVQNGMGQTRKVYSRGNNVFNVHFDAWESTSSSAWSGHLSGLKRASILFHVRTINKEQKKWTFECSCIAIGYNFSENKSSIINSSDLTSKHLFDNFEELDFDDL